MRFFLVVGKCSVEAFIVFVYTVHSLMSHFTVCLVVKALKYPLLDPMVERLLCYIFLYHKTEKAMIFCLLFVAVFPWGKSSRLSYN